MHNILHIESATRVCSVALSGDGKLVAMREKSTGDYSHSSLLTVFVKEVLEEASLPLTALSAVSVSMGPGSYTGLRIGTSAAKGLCYGLDIPLIAVSTPLAMAYHCRNILSKCNRLISPEALEALYCPMIDARRMEVYAGLFDYDLNPVTEIEATVIEEDSFSDILDNHKILFFGDGAGKCKKLLTRTNAIFIDDIHASSKGLIEPATARFNDGAFEDTAYFEPFYLKNFVAGIPRVKGLYRNF